MKRVFLHNSRQAQTAIEYLLLFAVVAIVALTAFNRLLPQVYQSQSADSSPNGFFSQVTRAIEGDKPDKINGGWCNVDSNSGSGLKPTCECPAPRFGGEPCP